jgi:uncharacterized membrane protein YkvA (DUF1232 family)
MSRPLRAVAQTLKRELRVYQAVLRDERTPRVARWLLGAAVAYALSPLDLIPDFIPLIGHLDDALIVPGLVVLALRLTPPHIVAECRARVVEEKL